MIYIVVILICVEDMSDENRSKRKEVFAKSADQGNSFGEFYLSTESEEDGSDDYSALRKSANQGNALAQHVLGENYENATGDVNIVDENIAMEWYTKAAMQGYSKSQIALGNRYYNAWNANDNGACDTIKLKDGKTALSWYGKANSFLGKWEQYKSGEIYLYTMITESAYEDYELARYWLTKAAEQGLGDSQHYLGELYLKGNGLPVKDYEKAFEWFKKGADIGNVYCQLDLGELYEKGLGTTKDDDRAFFYYMKAANHTDSKGEYQIGRMYENGIGVEQDLEKAKEWYEKSAAQGYEEAKEKLALDKFKTLPIVIDV